MNLIKKLTLLKIEGELVKTCNRCKRHLPSHFFSKINNPKRECEKDGLAISCFDCARLRSAKWREEKKGAVGLVALTQKKIELERYLVANPHLFWCVKGQHVSEKENVTIANRNSSGLGSICKNCKKQFYKINPEYSKIYYQNNKAQVLEASKEYSKNNQAKIAKMRKNWVLANPDKVRASIERSVKVRAEKRRKVSEELKSIRILKKKTIKEKTCSKCNNILSIENFRSNTNICKDCKKNADYERIMKKLPVTVAEERCQKHTEKKARDKYILANPSIKWCEKGKHFVCRSEFYSAAKRKDGLMTTCQSCLKKYINQNIEVVKKRRKSYYARNRDLIIKRSYLNYKQNKYKILGRQKAYNQVNKDTIQQRKKHYYQNNFANNEEYRAKTRAYREKHAQRISVYKQRGFAKLRSVRQNIKGEFSLDQWLLKIEFHGYCCYLCGKSLQGKKFHLEHRIPLSRGGTNFLANVAPSCVRCNLSKGNKTEFEFREWKKQNPKLRSKTELISAFRN